MKCKDKTAGLGSVVNTGGFLSPSLLVVKNMLDTSTSGHIVILLIPVTLLQQDNFILITILSYFLNYEAPHSEFTL